MKGKIIPHVGFDKVRFGQSEKQVTLLLGKPDDISRVSYTDNSVSIVLQYFDLGVELDFSSDHDFLLGAITFHSNEHVLNGVDLIGLNESGFIMRAKMIFSDLKLDDDFKDIDSKDYISDLNGISFWLDNEIVESISIFPEYKDDDETPNWPS